MLLKSLKTISDSIDLVSCFLFCVFVKDSVSGVKAGVAAGMPVVGVASRNPEQYLLDAGASFVIKDFNDPKLWSALYDF